MRALWRIFTDPVYRHARRLAWFKPRAAFQPYGFTAENRYPRIFAFARKALGARPDLRVLSFGCATGEEVFTLARYFPTAAIKGIDINPASIASAAARLAAHPDPHLEFVEAGSAAGEPAGSYDAIFCMSVLRDGRLGRAPERCDHLIRFEDFERVVGEFARALAPGGLLAIRNSNFRFSDTACARRFETVLSVAHHPALRPQPLYGPDNRLLKGSVYEDCVFAKRT